MLYMSKAYLRSLQEAKRHVLGAGNEHLTERYMTLDQRKKRFVDRAVDKKLAIELCEKVQ